MTQMAKGQSVRETEFLEALAHMKIAIKYILEDFIFKYKKGCFQNPILNHQV